jgi:hypothetical protein
VSLVRRSHVPFLLAGVTAVLAGAVLALAPAKTVRDVGAVPAMQARASATAAPATAPPVRASATPRPPAVASPPIRLGLPAGDTARVVPVGVKGRGALALPDDPHVVGWWSGGAAPGATGGSVVLAGHVDTAAAGPGALSTLAKLDPGALVRLETRNGRYGYRVVARRTYPKSALPLDVFDQAATARLVLITCTGSFHDGHYDDNLVVYARPTPTPDR